MRTLLTAFALLCCVLLQAQDFQTEIDAQVWKPFIQAYNTFDTEKFMALYSKNVVRVPVDEKKILNFTEYRKNINRENQFNKNYNIKASLELRFTERIHTHDTAYEKGIMQIKLTDNTGKPATLYSQFQVLLKKENGTWKIAFDSDSAKDTTENEKAFKSAKPLSL
jgi:ketosteroid isomerase-like protein